MENKELTFEEKLARLDEIVKKMSESNAPLNEMLSLYEEAQKLIKEETDTLNEAKAKKIALKPYETLVYCNL